jgi:hypothetical protein
MREYSEDFNDIEFDDNEIIDRYMREWEMAERRKATGARRVPARSLSALIKEDIDVDLDDDSGPYDDFDNDDATDYDDEF